MPVALPRLDTRLTYQRLATLYTVVFAAAAGSFYISLLESGYDVSLALFAAVAAALHYCLLRLAVAPQVESAPIEIKRYRPASLLADGDLMLRIDQLRGEARTTREEVGLMLITLSAGDAGSPAPMAGAMKLVQGELFRGADSRIFQVDESTLAIAECQSDVVLHFDNIALELHRQLRGSYPRPADSIARATVGVAVSGGGRSSAQDLLENARTAIRLAEANKRDTFFRRVS